MVASEVFLGHSVEEEAPGAGSFGRWPLDLMMFLVDILKNGKPLRGRSLSATASRNTEKIVDK